MNAIIQTLKGRGTNGESIELYPRTLIDAIFNQNGDTLQNIIDNRVNNSELTIKEYIAEQISNSNHLRRVIVTEIPTKENAEDNVIYMYKVESAVGNDVYQEYQLIGGKVVLVGDTSVDLSNYVQSPELDKILSGEVSVGNSLKLGGISANEWQSEINEKVESELAVDFAEARSPEFQENINTLTNKVDELKTDLGKAITNIKYIDGVYIESNGSQQPIDTFKASDYIDISEFAGQTLVLYSSLIQYAGFAFYDNTKKCIISVTGNSSGLIHYNGYYRFTIPINASYLRFSIYKQEMSEGKIFIYPSCTGIAELMKKVHELYAHIDISNMEYLPNSAVRGFDGVIVEEDIPLLSSDYVDVSEYELCDMHITSIFNGWAGIAFYDEYKNYITGYSGDMLGITANYPVNVNLIIPRNAYYIRYTTNSNFPDGYEISINTNSRHGVIDSLKDIEENLKNIKKSLNSAYKYAIEKILCIGDSLTSGACYIGEWAGSSIEQNYPRYLARMLNCNVTNVGHSGISASGWYNTYINKYNFADYDAFVIWLGTNYGCNAMPTDAEINAFTPNSSVSAENANQALYLIEIIKTIQTANPDAYILLGNCFASKSNVATNNATIESIAEKYGCVLLDMSDLGVGNHPELHGGVNNPHFGKAGNIFIANRICERINEDLNADPLRAEFGYTERTN